MLLNISDVHLRLILVVRFMQNITLTYALLNCVMYFNVIIL